MEERILSYIKRYGPVSSFRIAKEVGLAPYIVSGVLADLKARKKIMQKQNQDGSLVYFVGSGADVVSVKKSQVFVKPKISMQPKSVPVEKPKPKIKAYTYLEKVEAWLKKKSAKIVNVDATHKKMEIFLPTSLGKQRYLVVVVEYKKRKATVSDLSAVFNRVLEEKVPAILVSKTGFAKSTENFWKKEYKSLIILVDGRSLC